MDDDFIMYCHKIITMLDEIQDTIRYEVDEFLADPGKNGPRVRVAQRIIHCVMWKMANLHLDLLVRKAVREDGGEEREANES